MTTKLKQAKMTWSPDEPGTIWGYPQGTESGQTVSYLVTKFGADDFQAMACHPGQSTNDHLGDFKTRKEAKAACAVDALKYL